MRINNYSKIDEIKALLNYKGWAPQKKFGQNYLIDLGSREFIWKILNPQSEDIIWEIGPGLGALTHKLAERGKPFCVFELDEGYADFLEESFSSKGLKMVRGDFLKTWPQIFEEIKPTKILGNLPYNVSSQMILALIEKMENLPFCVFTIQKELALRISAKVGEKDYSAFSLLCQWAFNVRLERVLPSGCFYPRPQVSSAVISLTPTNRYSLESFKDFQTLVKASFSSRRKMLKNNLQKYLLERGIEMEKAQTIFKEQGLSLNQRAEELTLENYVFLASLLS